MRRLKLRSDNIDHVLDSTSYQTDTIILVITFPAPLKLRPYGAVQICLLLLLLLLLFIRHD